MRLLKKVLLICLLLFAPWVSADLVLVANPASGIEQLTKSQVINIYLGRYRRLATGATAVPLDLPANSASKAEFYQRLVNKNLAEINSYWSRLIFSGKTHPPLEVKNTDEAIKLVISNPNALAYIDRSAVTSEVVIVFEWPK